MKVRLEKFKTVVSWWLLKIINTLILSGLAKKEMTRKMAFKIFTIYLVNI